MLVISFATWYEKIQATVRNGTLVHAFEEHVLQGLYNFQIRLTHAEVKLERVRNVSG